MKTSSTISKIEDFSVIDFGFCKDCLEEEIKMSVPQGAFASIKVRKNMNKMIDDYAPTKQEPSKYNSKYMNSIWGMYNRFSVHNLKKLTDSNASQSTVQGVKGLNASSQLSVSVERISNVPL
ncbi:uncharacterized protein LOC115879379 [Sitophilus oryzae]|uniref:Uncharacterized protein LOC115879379 n=1 Tax=Sitophilus oryzae TaxID=7048 RepID=A0A6J2XMY8_SITOR|nr:uncharacterized protein LOC115879379 [Sitophilus oryzae]